MTRRIVIAHAVLASALAIGLAAGERQPVLINAAGATFPYPIYSKWFEKFHEKFPNTQINYQPIGSGTGIQQVTAATIDFGATDGPMTDAQMRDFQEKRGSPVLHFPTVLGAVVPAYNLPGAAASLNFTGEVLAEIFLGKITQWDDPKLTKLNPGVKLPSSAIRVVHRADNSGTTYVWSDYLSKISGEWEMKAGRATSLNWPVGIGGRGNEGVSEAIQQTPNSIGYVELVYAAQMKYGKVKNARGEFIQASLASVTAAAASVSMPDDFRVSITDSPGTGAYPISSFTWLLIPSKIPDPAKRKAIRNFVSWMLTDGQKMSEALSYAPLPAAVVAKEVKVIDKLQ
jgi:phosphate transport system substrate-binding protein